MDSGDSYFTHDALAEKFNDFLSACGYSGHDYVNFKDAERAIKNSMKKNV